MPILQPKTTMPSRARSFRTVIMRAQMFHLGHAHLIHCAYQDALEHDEYPIILILIGSVNRRRSWMNPFSFQQIQTVIQQYVKNTYGDNAHVMVLPMNDHPGNDSQWVLDVQQTVEHFVSTLKAEFAPLLDYNLNKIVGHTKDASSFYLKAFPQWKEHLEAPNFKGINATDLRLAWFRSSQTIPDIINGIDTVLMPKEMRDFLWRWEFNPALQQDFDYYTRKEPEMFASYPFPEDMNFCCADVVLECSGHVLLIKRGENTGIGTWALPGGFKRSDETFQQSALRELTEETVIKVPKQILERSIVKEHLFDDPKRSQGFTRVTIGFHIKIDLNADGTLPRVSATKEATEVKFVEINEALNTLQLYDDHGGIISKLTGVVPQPAYLNPLYR